MLQKSIDEVLVHHRVVHPAKNSLLDLLAHHVIVLISISSLGNGKESPSDRWRDQGENVGGGLGPNPASFLRRRRGWRWWPETVIREDEDTYL